MAPPDSVLDSAATLVVERNPFRLDRMPADVAFGLSPESVVAAQAPQPRPQPPVVTAVLGGPPWRAVLENLPGRDGPLVVATGERVGLYSILSISAAGVHLKGADTTWQLRLRVP